MSPYDKLEYIRITLQEVLDESITPPTQEELFWGDHLDIYTVKRSLKYIDDLKFETEVKL
jgi:hypothetical protein